MPGPGSWLFAFVVGMAMGGFVAGRTWSQPVRDVPEIWVQRFGRRRLWRYLATFAGGFLILFAARLAGGCTYGWDDEDMEQAIENALVTNPRVMSFHVNTSVDDGVATLTGTGDNLEAKRAAEQEADDTLGVWRVRNFLRVRPEFERTDLEIANDIRDALRRDPYVDRYDITVGVHSGVATLMGTVEDWDELRAAKKNARDGGATSVISKLDIENGFGTG